MKALFEILVRRRWPLFTFVMVAVLVPLVAVPDGSGTTTALTVGFLVAAAAAVIALVLNLAGLDPDAPRLASDLVPNLSGGALLSRWLRRSRYYRFVGGTVGFIVGLGFTSNGQYISILLGLLAGVAMGGALAEVHLLRRNRPSARDADLAIRRMADYVMRPDVVALGGIAGVAVLLGVTAVGWPPVNRAETLAWAVAALVTVAATSGLQRLVVTRSRPAVSAELRAADDLLRRLAVGQGFARPAMALGMGLIAESVSSLGSGTAPGRIAFVIWLLALAWYSTSRPDREHLAKYRVADA